MMTTWDFFSLGRTVVLSSARGSNELPCCFPEIVNWRVFSPPPPQPGHLMNGPFIILVYARFSIALSSLHGLFSCAAGWVKSKLLGSELYWSLMPSWVNSTRVPHLSFWFCILIYFVLSRDFSFSFLSLSFVMSVYLSMYLSNCISSMLHV